MDRWDRALRNGDGARWSGKIVFLHAVKDHIVECIPVEDGVSLDAHTPHTDVCEDAAGCAIERGKDGVSLPLVAIARNCVSPPGRKVFATIPPYYNLFPYRKTMPAVLRRLL